MKSQWKNLRENLRRCIVKRDTLSKSGAAAHTLPKCKYFSQLQFLHEKVTNKETVSNFNNPIENTFSVPASPASSVGSSDESRYNGNLPHYEPPVTPGSSTDKPPPSRKRKRPSTGGDDEFLSVIQEMSNTTKSMISEESNKVDNENMLFCKSLAPVLDRLPKKDAALAKIKIQNVRYELEFKD